MVIQYIKAIKLNLFHSDELSINDHLSSVKQHMLDNPIDNENQVNEFES